MCVWQRGGGRTIELGDILHNCQGQGVNEADDLQACGRTED